MVKTSQLLMGRFGSILTITLLSVNVNTSEALRLSYYTGGLQLLHKANLRRHFTSERKSVARLRKSDELLIQALGMQTKSSVEIGCDGNSSRSNALSIREMLEFAVPALGIFLSGPLLSNIDNAFIGRIDGTLGLAALSPATICTDQVLYLFSFLSRATTGTVSRGGDASPPLTAAIICGSVLTVLYAIFTPNLLRLIRVESALMPAASSYVWVRGIVAWAALAQGVCTAVLLANRDSVTPLRAVALAAVVNILGDTLLCAWPLQLGCAGAAGATAVATLVGAGAMAISLQKKKILPQIRVPTRHEVLGLLEFTGPLLAITITRLLGFVSMQRTAMKNLGVDGLAGYQLCVNVMVFFMLFGEPLSQLGQTLLPNYIDKRDGDGVVHNLRSILALATYAVALVGSLTFATLYWGAGFFTADPSVILQARYAAPVVTAAVSQAIYTFSLDGAMLASKDFGFMLSVGTMCAAAQVMTLQRCTTIDQIFATFTGRLGSYAVCVLARVATGGGALGCAIRESQMIREWTNKRGQKQQSQADTTAY